MIPDGLGDEAHLVREGSGAPHGVRENCGWLPERTGPGNMPSGSCSGVRMVRLRWTRAKTALGE